MVEWIKFVEEDISTLPEWSGNWDACSKEVLVEYTVRNHSQKQYGVGYADWDGDNHYWNIIPITGNIQLKEVLRWAYFNKE